MTNFILAILSVTLVSLISLIGLFTISIKEEKLNQILIFFVAFSAGAMLGGAFLHLLPESLEVLPINTVAPAIIIGFVLFFIVEKFLHWHHCHDQDCQDHKKFSFAYTNLVGDAVHNFIDGLIIAGSFAGGWQLGITTTIAVIIHEIPQEISDFGVLIYAGIKKRKALILNFLSAITAITGCIIGSIFAQNSETIKNLLLPLAAGGFLYISATDLTPELHKEESSKKSILLLVFFTLGIMFMYITRQTLKTI